MATGIVSVAILDEQATTLSRVLLAVCAVTWAILAALLVAAVLGAVVLGRRASRS